MELDFKKRFLLLALCEKKYDGKFYDAAGLFSTNKIDVSPAELKDALDLLGSEHLVKTFFISDRYLVQITVDGVEFLEENSFFDERNEAVRDRMKPLQREILRHQLDDFTLRVCQSDLGKQLDHEQFVKEIEELKALLNILGRKHWMQILKGKFYEFCDGNMPLRRLKKILDAFEHQQTQEVLTNQSKGASGSIAN